MRFLWCVHCSSTGLVWMQEFHPTAVPSCCLSPFCLQCRESRKVVWATEAQAAVTAQGDLEPALPFVLLPQAHESLARCQKSLECPSCSFPAQQWENNLWFLLVLHGIALLDHGVSFGVFHALWNGKDEGKHQYFIKRKGIQLPKKKKKSTQKKALSGWCSCPFCIVSVGKGLFKGRMGRMKFLHWGVQCLLQVLVSLY